MQFNFFLKKKQYNIFRKNAGFEKISELWEKFWSLEKLGFLEKFGFLETFRICGFFLEKFQILIFFCICRKCVIFGKKIGFLAKNFDSWKFFRFVKLFEKFQNFENLEFQIFEEEKKTFEKCHIILKLQILGKKNTIFGNSLDFWKKIRIFGKKLDLGKSIGFLEKNYILDFRKYTFRF